MKPIGTLASVAALVLFAAALLSGLLSGCGFDHPEVGTQVAHAAPGETGKGCAKCHNAPVVATCIICHPSPPTMVRGIAFPHHNVASGAPFTNCQMCHSGSDSDARYVKVLKSSMSSCKACHQFTHTSR